MNILKKIAVLVPVFNEAKSVSELYLALNATLSRIHNYATEIIFINDGSADQSAELILKLADTDKSITYVELSRNFGKEAALSAGINSVAHDVTALIMIDADLQHPPSVIPAMIREWEKGFEIVSARRTYLKNPPFAKRIGSSLFYYIMSQISETEILSRTTDFRLLDRAVIDAFQSLTERNRMVRGLIDWMGFRKATIEFDAPPRSGGDPGYSYAKLIRLAMNAMTSFSLFPLKIAGYTGVLCSSFSGTLLFYMVLDRAFFKYWSFTNLAFVIVINSFMIGLVLTCLGLIALYIGNIHIEVLNRPLYIVRRKLTGAAANSPK